MPVFVKVAFVSLTDVGAVRASPDTASTKGVKGGDSATTLVVFAGDDLALSPATKAALGDGAAAIERAARTAKFKGKTGGALEILAPHGLSADRLLVIGCGRKLGEDDGGPERSKEPTADFVLLGGMTMGRLGTSGGAKILLDLPDMPDVPGALAADFALGLTLRAYRFDTYRTRKKKDDTTPAAPVEIAVATKDPAAAKTAYMAEAALGEGVYLARDLVNEPPNILYPVEFAERARQLEKLGVIVEVLDVPAMEKLGMGALLGVGQGSAKPSRTVIMRWNGAGGTTKPLAFVGKGVCFDTGGISIKPAGGMEDMKGDMAGAACVVGLMHALAGRKAKVDVIGAIGIVENMPGSNAQRPGDIVRSMSGQTIEIINTDAEGRLVLADVLWYVQETHKPRFMIDLATLTGAIMVALGQEYAGMFCNNNELAAQIEAAGKATGEEVWRLPLGPKYDKMIDSKFADMKNTGGRHGGSITAAQFLQRFVNRVNWAHLDIAGTGMGSPASDINQSWASGWGVRMLDRLTRDHYES